MASENEKSSVIIAELDSFGVFLFSEGGTSKYIGLESSQIIGKSAREVYKDFPELNDKIARALQGEASTTLVNMNGSIFEFSYIPIFNNSGKLQKVFSVALDKTESTKIEIELKDTINLLNQAQKIAKTGNWELDLTTNNLSWSEEVYRIFEIDKNTFRVSYAEFLNLVHPDDRNFVNEAYLKSIKDKTIYSIEHRLLMKNGEVKYVHEQCITYYNSEGNPVRSIGTIQDITEKKIIEKRLKESETKYRLLVEEASEVFYFINFDKDSLHGDVKFVSMQTKNLTGYDNHEFINDPDLWLRLVHPEDINNIIESTQSILTSHSKGVRVYRIWNRIEKKYKWMEDLIIPRYDAKGTIIGYQGVARDITDRKSAENALKKSEALYRLLFEQAPYGVLLIDIETGNIVEVNDAAIKQLSYSREKFLSLKITDFDARKDPGEVSKHLKRIEFNGSDEFETIFRKSDGQLRSIKVFAKSLNIDNHVYAFSIFQDITEQKEAAKIILTQAEQFNSLLRTTSDGFWIVDQSGNLKEVNDAYCRMSGYSRDELLKMSIPDLEANETHEDTVKHIMKVMETGSDIFESRHRAKDKSIFNVEVSAVYDKKRKEFFGFIRDITQQKSAENLLQETNERFQLAQEAGNVGVWEWDISTNRIYWTDNINLILGYNTEIHELTIDVYYQLIHPDDRETVKKNTNESIEQNKLYELEYRIIKNDGTICWIFAKGKVFKDETGKPEKMIGIIQDINERKTIENELRLKDNAVKNSINGIAFCNIDGIIQYVNKSFLSMWGYASEEEVLGKHANHFWENSIDAFQFINYLQAGNQWIGEFKAKRKDGSLFDCSISANCLTDKGNTTYLMASFLDISEREKQQSVILESLKEKELLLKEIHHRVKNNLQIIISLIYLQSQKAQDPKTMDICSESLNRIKSMGLIHEYLYQSKDFKHIDFKDYLIGLISILKESYKTKNIPISFELNVKEKVKFEQATYCGLIINELVSNALKHAFIGRKNGKIKIGFEKHNGNYMLTVLDDGIGIHNLNAVDENKSLGLKIVRTLTEQLKGDVNISVNSGTLIQVLIPYS